MSGLFPAGSEGGEEEREGGEVGGRDASVSTVNATRGHPRVAPAVFIRLGDRKRVLPPTDSDSSVVN